MGEGMEESGEYYQAWVRCLERCAQKDAAFGEALPASREVAAAISNETPFVVSEGEDICSWKHAWEPFDGILDFSSIAREPAYDILPQVGIKSDVEEVPPKTEAEEWNDFMANRDKEENRDFPVHPASLFPNKAEAYAPELCVYYRAPEPWEPPVDTIATDETVERKMWNQKNGDVAFQQKLRKLSSSGWRLKFADNRKNLSNRQAYLRGTASTCGNDIDPLHGFNAALNASQMALDVLCAAEESKEKWADAAVENGMARFKTLMDAKWDTNTEVVMGYEAARVITEGGSGEVAILNEFGETALAALKSVKEDTLRARFAAVSKRSGCIANINMENYYQRGHVVKWDTFLDASFNFTKGIKISFNIGAETLYSDKALFHVFESIVMPAMLEVDPMYNRALNGPESPIRLKYEAEVADMITNKAQSFYTTGERRGTLDEYVQHATAFSNALATSQAALDKLCDEYVSPSAEEKALKVKEHYEGLDAWVAETNAIKAEEAARKPIWDTVAFAEVMACLKDSVGPGALAVRKMDNAQYIDELLKQADEQKLNNRY